MARGRVHLPDGLKNLLASDWERVMAQAMLSTEDRTILRLYVLERIPQIDVAAELHMDRSTISRRMKSIFDEARRTAERLDMV
nr:MAG: ECF sigma factor [Bacteriophage sp.]